MPIYDEIHVHLLTVDGAVFAFMKLMLILRLLSDI